MDWIYSKTNNERIKIAQRLDKVLRVSFNGNAIIEVPYGGFKEDDYTKAGCSYHEYENAIMHLVGDGMLSRHNMNNYKLTEKGWAFMATVEKLGYEFQLREKLRNDLINKIILVCTILGILIALFNR